MDWHEQNIKVYNDSAKGLSEYFSGIGSRVEDVNRGLGLAGKNDGAKVVELGCGDGRDAVEIIKRVDWYEGIDPSEGLLNIAGVKNPDGSFVLADALSYEYPNNLDVIFAFASLLHIDQNGLHETFEKASQALRIDGIFYISLKERADYAEAVKEDQYGRRMFYYYNPAVIQHVAGSLFQNVFETHQTIGQTDWFTIALKRVAK